MSLLALAGALAFVAGAAIVVLGLLWLVRPRAPDARMAWLGTGLVLLGALVAALTWWNNIAPTNDPPFARELEAALGPAAALAFLVAALARRDSVARPLVAAVLVALAAIAAALVVPASWSLAHRTGFALAALLFAAQARTLADRWIALAFVSYATWDAARLSASVVSLGSITPLRLVLLAGLPIALAGAAILARRAPALRLPIVAIVPLAVASVALVRLVPQGPRAELLLLVTAVWRLAFVACLVRGVAEVGPIRGASPEPVPGGA